MKNRNLEKLRSIFAGMAAACAAVIVQPASLGGAVNLVTRSDQIAVQKDLTRIIEDTLVQVRPNLVPLVCSMGDEEGAYTTIATPANVPFPTPFTGERKVAGKDVPVKQTYNQQTHELTIQIDSDLLNNAHAYDLSTVVREATMSAVVYPDYLLSIAINNGTSATLAPANDGKAFYATNHLYANSGSNTINNLLTGNGTTVQGIYTDLSLAIAAIKGYKDNANPGHLLNAQTILGPQQFIIRCPLSLEQNMKTVIHSTMIAMPVTSGIQTVAAAPVTNTLMNAADIFVDGYMTGNSWELHYVGMPMRPFIYRANYEMKMEVLGIGSEFESLQNAISFNLRRRFVLGFHRFDRSVRITNT